MMMGTKVYTVQNNACIVSSNRTVKSEKTVVYMFSQREFGGMLQVY